MSPFNLTHRCSFIDFQEALTIECRTALVDRCDFAAFDRSVDRLTAALTWLRVERLGWGLARSAPERESALHPGSCTHTKLRYHGPTCRGPLLVSCGHNADVVSPADYEDINSKLLFLEVSWAASGRVAKGMIAAQAAGRHSCPPWPALCLQAALSLPALPMLIPPHCDPCSPSPLTRATCPAGCAL